MLDTPASSLKDVVYYLKSDEHCPGTETPLSMIKEISEEDRLDLRWSLDAVRAAS